MASNAPVWRSMMFVPTINEKFIEKAPGVGADAVILDLEDSIAASAKEKARDAVASVAQASWPIKAWTSPSASIARGGWRPGTLKRR